MLQFPGRFLAVLEKCNIFCTQSVTTPEQSGDCLEQLEYLKFCSSCFHSRPVSLIIHFKSWRFSSELQNISTCPANKMVQRYEGRVCPIHTHVEWELQDVGNNVPTTNKELKRVSHGENSCRKDGEYL